MEKFPILMENFPILVENFPILVENFPIVVKKAVNNMQARHSQYQRQQQHKQEGEVTVESNRRQQSRTNNTEGEYVDFEEVD